MNRDLETKRGPGWCRSHLSSVACGAVLLLVLFTNGLAAEKQPRPLKIVGLATEVEPTRVTIRDKKGNEVTLRPTEDFSEKFAVGSTVTAWYLNKGDSNELQWLEYPLENSFVSPKQFCPRIKKIILLPSSQAGDADGLFDAVEGYLQSKIGLFAAHRMLADEIRNRANESNSTLKYVDPETGDLDLAAYAEPHRKLIQRIASVTKVDAVLEASVEVVQANFHSQLAVWDGAKQPVASATSRTLAFIAILPVNGHVPASTVVLKLWDAQGKLLWSNRRGFCVLALQKGVGANFRDYSILDALQDSASVEKWMATVFASWLPSPVNSSTTAAKP